MASNEKGKEQTNPKVDEPKEAPKADEPAKADTEPKPEGKKEKEKKPKGKGKVAAIVGGGLGLLALITVGAKKLFGKKDGCETGETTNE